MNVNQKLTALMKASGVTIAKLAEESGVSTRQITRIRSDLHETTLPTMTALAAALGVSPAVLVDNEVQDLDVALIALSALGEADLAYARHFIDAVLAPGDET